MGSGQVEGDVGVGVGVELAANPTDAMTPSMFMTLDGVVGPGQQWACPALQRRAG
jgi:hypothetical protein